MENLQILLAFKSIQKLWLRRQLGLDLTIELVQLYKKNVGIWCVDNFKLIRCYNEKVHL